MGEMPSKPTQEALQIQTSMCVVMRKKSPMSAKEGVWLSSRPAGPTVRCAELQYG